MDLNIIKNIISQIQKHFRGERNHDKRQDHTGDSCLEMVTQKIRRTMNTPTTFIRIELFFAAIILFGLSACTSKQAKQNTRPIMVEKKWAKDCNNDSKIHILAYNAQLTNGEKVLTHKQEYIKMTKDCLNDVETLIAKYLDEKDKNHYFASNPQLIWARAISAEGSLYSHT